MNLLRIAIFKRQPSFLPSDKTVIILHLHDKCGCLCTRLCMYVWVLKRTLATVGHDLSSFILAGRGFSNVESGSLSLCSSSECSSLATVSQRALKWSQGLSQCGILLTLRLCICVFVCIRLHLCILPSESPLSFYTYVGNLAACCTEKRLLII